MARQRLVAGNWKMYGSAALVDEFMAVIANGRLPAGVETLICPPFPYIARMAGLAAGSALQVGGQSLCDQGGPGAYTGEVSAAMLADSGAGHAIVGHSERRALYHEDDDTVAVKFSAAQAAGLIPILCVGETLGERDGEQTEDVLRRQLGAVLAKCGVAALAGAVLAYEPVWAIGSGRTATPEQAQGAHAFLRGQVAAEDAKIAHSLRILYGGSVKPDNAAGLFACADVDGALVGGASLDAESFLAICRASLTE